MEAKFKQSRSSMILWILWILSPPTVLESSEASVLLSSDLEACVLTCERDMSPCFGLGFSGLG